MQAHRAVDHPVALELGQRLGERQAEQRPARRLGRFEQTAHPAGEVVAVRQIVERGHRGRPYTATYIKVSYRDQTGGRHEIEETAWHAQPGDARMIRYPSFQPSNGRIDEGVWLIWKPCMFAWLIFGGILGTAAYVRFSIQELKGEPEGGSGQTVR